MCILQPTLRIFLDRRWTQMKSGCFRKLERGVGQLLGTGHLPTNVSARVALSGIPISECITYHFAKLVKRATIDQGQRRMRQEST